MWVQFILSYRRVSGKYLFLNSFFQQSAAGFCLILMAVYWATEAFPIAVTALLPVMLFPMTGLMTGKDVSKTYINVSHFNGPL